MLVADLGLGEWAERAGWIAVPRHGTWYLITMRNCGHAFLLNLVPRWPRCPKCRASTEPGVIYEVIRG